MFEGKKYFSILIFVVALLFVMDIETVEAASGYLSGYEEVEPQSAGVSWWSTLAYVLSLLAVFAIVFVMAYIATKFLSGRFNARISNHGGRVLENLPLGPNRSVCIVDMAGRVFLLGVTDQSITMLSEVLDPDEIDRLRKLSESNSDFFSEELGSLSSLMDKLSSLRKKH